MNDQKTLDTMPDMVDKIDKSVEYTEEVVPEQEEENVTFITNNMQYGVDVENNLNALSGEVFDKAPLATALSRPTKLTEFTWATATPLRADIDIWTLWQSDTFIKSKLQNFAYLRCNLNIKIVLSATPFQYGRLMFNYVPYGDNNEIFYNNKTVLYTGGVTSVTDAYRQYMSTYPITAFADPSQNNVVNMKIPFIWHKNYISINGINGTGKETLGLLTYTTLNDLRVANSTATTSLNVSVFAYASEVELVMPTNFTPTAKRIKMGRKTEESEDGIVSSTSSAVAAAAGQLTKVPIIGPFAKATEIGAGAISQISRLFGFSSLPMKEAPVPRSLRMYSNLANTIKQDTSEKLSMDPNQELTIDPRVVGWSPNDDMAFSTIVSKEQWLCKGEWNGSTGQFVTAGATEIVVASLVCPLQARVTPTFGTAPIKQAIQLSPAGHIGHLFRYWRGKIIYRIEVVASKYHSGALQIQFDPMVKSTALAVADVYVADTNTRQTAILDISETKELEIEIDYVSHAPFLAVPNITSSTFQPISGSDTTFSLQATFNPEQHLGILSVSVLNELVAPGDVAAGAEVDVNLYMRCSEDLIFAEPVGGWEGDLFKPTAGCVASTLMSKRVIKGEVTLATTISEENTSTNIDGHVQEMKPTASLTSWQKRTLVEAEESQEDILTFFGERFVSIRSLLKRYVTVKFDVAKSGAGSGGAELVTLYLPHFGPEVDYTNLDNRRNCYESYLSPCYLIKRGGMRHKLMIFSGTAAAPVCDSYLAITRASDTGASLVGAPTVSNVNIVTVGTMLTSLSTGAYGMQVSEKTYNPCVDVESPFYSNTRYTLACDITNVDASNTLLRNTTMDEILYLQAQYWGLEGGQYRYQHMMATGEDYNLVCFQAPPTHWILT